VRLAYVGKTPSGNYKPFFFNQALMTADVELSEEIFIVMERSLAGLRSSANPNQRHLKKLAEILLPIKHVYNSEFVQSC